MRLSIFKRTVVAAACLLFVMQSFAASPVEAWRKKLSAVALTVAINPLNPNTVYAEKGFNLLSISFDKGKTWPLISHPGVGSIRQILVHPTDTMTIFCAGGSGDLRKSTDYGATW
jgi:hypothetical protein